MAKPTLNGISLEGVQNIASSKTGNVAPLPIPTGDSNQTEVFDLLGAVRSITLSGDYAGSSISVTKAFLESIEALLDGDQTTISFVSDQTGTKTVMVASFDYDWTLPGYKVSYTLKLIEGTTL